MLKICDHPIIVHNLNLMRRVSTPPSEFRSRLKRIAQFLVYEATQDLAQSETKIETPLEEMTGKLLTDPEVLLVSILRAGNGFLDGALEILPEAKVGFVGVARDHETLLPHEYYINLPDDLKGKSVLLLDPMLATGGSAIDAIDALKKRGADDVAFITLVAAPEGVKAVSAHAPEIKIYTAALDRELNEKGYILPGLGDAGDRIFNS